MVIPTPQSQIPNMTVTGTQGHWEKDSSHSVRHKSVAVIEGIVATPILYFCRGTQEKVMCHLWYLQSEK